MKKFLLILILLLNCIVFTACAVQSANPSQSSQSSSAQSSQNSSSKPTSSKDSSSKDSLEDKVHVHSMIKMQAQESTCETQGKVEHYYCYSCKKYYLDENGESEISQAETLLALTKHTLTKKEEIPSTCGEYGVREHWLCEVCNGTFADEECTVRLNSTTILLEKLPHEGMVYFNGYPVNGNENGRVEHWFCEHCNKYFLDKNGKQEVEQVDTILYSALNIPNFLVNVPEDREPVILQLTDTQIMDGGQTPPNKSPNDRYTYPTAAIKKYCYDYITEIVNATNPDLILLTGDLIYGVYDHNGSALQGLISHMESFKIPWAPVFGNHDGESNMGVDWQCEQLENAEYCLFEQNTLSGSGNYSVGIVQGEKLTRVFYMLDSKGCSDASSTTLASDPSIRVVGFGADQVEWYTNQIKKIKELSPETKFSFAFHIQLAIFAEAYAEYGFDNSASQQEIFIDFLQNKKDGDFGYLGRPMKNGWDSADTVYKGFKELGVDSIFVGHEHCNSASVVYEGIRFQYGQKSSEYDRFNGIDSNGKLFATYLYRDNDTVLIGGTVIKLSNKTGEIIDGYIYYCNNAYSQINGSYYSK